MKGMEDLIKQHSRKSTMTILACMMTLALLITACSGGNGGGKNNDGGTAPAKGSPLELAYKGEYKGKKVTMMGPFVDGDEIKFLDAIKEFEEKTGIDIQYEGSKEFEATIGIRIDGNNAPDISDFPQPGLLATFVKQGKVIDVSTFLDAETMKKNYNQSWLDMASMEGPNGKIMAGVWNRSSVKSLVWYPKKQFEEAGYKVPTTWEELLALTEQIAKDGDPAWAIGIESGAATGWPATDWVEDIMLRTTTPENYDKWVKGELPFTDPVVKNAVEKMSEIWMNKDYVYGGAKSIVTTGFGDSVKPMFETPAKAWLHRQASFITTFFPEGLKAGEDYDWFYFPPIDKQYGSPVLVAGDIYAMHNDRPEVRAVMQFFTTGESIKTWVQSGGVIAPMNDASLDWYPSEAERRMGELVQNASTLRFDGSDLMPGSVGAGTFWKGMTDYVSGTAPLDKVLEEIQAGFNK